MDRLARRLFLGHDRLTGALACARDDLDHAPALGGAQGARLDDAHRVTDARLVVLVVRLELGREANHALVERVARQALDRYDDRLVHLVRHDPADLCLLDHCALSDCAHSSSPLAASAVVSAPVVLLVAAFPAGAPLVAPSFLVALALADLAADLAAAARAAGLGEAVRGTIVSSRLRSVMTVSTRAIERRVWVSWL